MLSLRRLINMTAQPFSAPLTQSRSANERRITELKLQIENEISCALAPRDASRVSRVKQAIRYSTLAKGHRWRPILFLLIMDALGKNAGDYLKAAAGLELMHTATLIIDDFPFIDNATLRRGQSCCHLRFGIDIATYASHIAFDLAERMLLHQAPVGIRERLLDQVVMLKETLVDGQCLERDLARAELPITLRNIQKQYTLKSGTFFKFCVQLAGWLANMDSETTSRLGRFGEETGVAYQISDDIADVSGKPSEIGKHIEMDVGKSNYPRWAGHEFAVKKLEEHHSRALLCLEDLFKHGTLKRNKSTLTHVLNSLVNRYEQSGKLLRRRGRASL